ncbi:MAG: beta-ketoacyl synthase N-terminal-like domain-containing protein, partial [Nitrospirota bacterium]
MNKVVVCAAKRTPFGKFGGALVKIGAVELGALVINKVLLEVPQVEASEVDEVILGNCLPGNGLSPARQSVLAAGWPLTANALTIDRACCSALTAAGLCYQHISGGFARICVAGGTENMSRTPYLIHQMRWGQRLGDFMVEDDLVIRNPYVGAPMAKYVGEFALEKNITRNDLDAWALRSHKLWADAYR